MLVIYTADVKRGTTNPVMDVGSNKFEITEAFLSELDHDKIWTKISDKVKSGNSLDACEMMESIIYPLTYSEMDKKQVAIKDVIELVSMIQNINCKRFILKCLLVFTEKVIREEDVRRIKEVLMLTRVEKMIYDEAEENVSIRIAKNFLASGSDVEYVAENTGLTKEVVMKLYHDITGEKE